MDFFTNFNLCTAEAGFSSGIVSFLEFGKVLIDFCLLDGHCSNAVRSMYICEGTRPDGVNFAQNNPSAQRRVPVNEGQNNRKWALGISKYVPDIEVFQL